MQNEIQVGRFNGILSKLLGITGAPAPVSATDIFPMLALEVDRPEWHFLGGERLCQMRWQDAAVAANFSSVGLRNPEGSGVLIVVESITMWFAANAQAYIGVRANTTIDASYPGRSRDTRNAAANAVGLLVERTQATAPAYQTSHVVALASTLVRDDTPWILTPGYELMTWPAAQNVAQTTTFNWRERHLEPSETR